MNRFQTRILVAAVAAAFAHAASGADFLQTYRLAKQNDAQFASSRASLEAGIEKLPQGRALLLPVINAGANTQYNYADNQTFNTSNNFNSNGWNVTLTQPIFRWQNLVQYQQSQFQVLQAEAQFGQATQDLIVRVAQAYFDVLAAQDNIEFIKANKAAIGEQLAQAKRNFEVGTATITDTNEAQARFDLATAQEIAGFNQLEIAQRALQQIIGRAPDALTPLRSNLVIAPPQPASMDDWATSSRSNNFTVRANEAVAEISDREVNRQRAGHLPNVDLVATSQSSTNVSPTIINAPRTQIDTNLIGLQVNVPIFAGGAVNSRTREAIALREKSQQDLEASRRTAEFNARQAFLNVTNGLAQVRALEQALVSSETALQSNRVGYEVGVRINIDVLNAQQQVFQTKRDLARARYDTIVNGLRLKSAAGALTEADVEDVNRLLGFDPALTPIPLPGGAPPPTPPARSDAGRAQTSAVSSDAVFKPRPGVVPVLAPAKASEPAPQAQTLETKGTATAGTQAAPVKDEPAPAPVIAEEPAPPGAAVAEAPAPHAAAIAEPAPPSTTFAEPAPPAAALAEPAPPAAALAEPASPAPSPDAATAVSEPTPAPVVEAPTLREPPAKATKSKKTATKKATGKPIAPNATKVEAPSVSDAEVPVEVPQLETVVLKPGEAAADSTRLEPVDASIAPPAPGAKLIAPPPQEELSAPAPPSTPAPAPEKDRVSGYADPDLLPMAFHAEALSSALPELAALDALPVPADVLPPLAASDPEPAPAITADGERVYKYVEPRIPGTPWKR